MTIGYAAALRNAQLDAITTRAGNAARLRIYSGARPATGGTPTGTLLVTLTCGTPFAAAAASGILTLGAISSATAVATGTASWFRIESSGGTHVLDGDVATSGADLNLSTTSIVSGATVAVTAATITRGNP